MTLASKLFLTYLAFKFFDTTMSNTVFGESSLMGKCFPTLMAVKTFIL